MPDLPVGSTVQSIAAINDHHQLLLPISDTAAHRTTTLVVQLV
ncbi:hypothetical protein [Streptomyces botrytidirepellens]|nr:hypothetical protein [Streptomyces botrytidirepellens]